MKFFDETNLSNFQARYGTDIPDNDYPTNEFIEQILSRKTIRRFDSTKQVHPKLYEKLIAAAQSAPTSSMLQPWSVIAVKSFAQRSKILAPKNRKLLGFIPNSTEKVPDIANLFAISECDTLFIWLVDHNIINAVINSSEVYDKHPNLAEFKDIAIESSTTFDIATRSMTDAIIAAQTFVLAAESVGLGTMYCGALRSIDLKEDFNLPSGCVPLFGICVGYPKQLPLSPFGLSPKDAEQPVYIKPRLPQSLILHHDTYQSLDFDKVKEYNNLMERFYHFYKHKLDWFDRVVRRTNRVGEYFFQIFKKSGLLK